MMSLWTERTARERRYEYSPHLPPVLRFDATGKADALPKLLAQAGKRALNADELKVLAEALRRHEPWLEWAGKRESDSTTNGRGALTVDPVALHIHERVSAQAVLRVAARQDVARSLFADPEQDYRDAVQFYKHDVDCLTPRPETGRLRYRLGDEPVTLLSG